MSNQSYNNSPSGYPQQGYGNNFGPPSSEEGAKHAQLALLFGVLGLFFVGIVFGPLAIVQAKKAERLGISATAGKVLGWISLIWSILAIVLFIAFFGLIIASMEAGLNAGMAASMAG